MVDRLVNSEANKKRIAFVEQCFGTSGQPLCIPGRVLVGEGILVKMCRKKPKPRQFFLFNDTLVYGNIVINKKKYNKQHIIPLEDVKLQSVQDDGSYSNGWQIISPSKSFTVYAATATEKSEWMAHINKCVQDLITKKGKKQSTEDSPVWVPDCDANKCMHCRKSEFNIVNRRHHCRRCGILVCGPCSDKKWLFPQQSSKPQRVCLTCYDKLSSSLSAGGVVGELRNQNKSKNITEDPAPPTQGADDQDSSGDDSSDEDDDVENTDNMDRDEVKFYESNQAAVSVEK